MDPRFRGDDRWVGDDRLVGWGPSSLVIPAKAGIHRRHKRGTIPNSFLFVLDKIVGIRYYQSCMHIIPVPIRDRSVARGASGSRAGRIPSLP